MTRGQNERGDELTEFHADVELDCIGLLCPAPIYRTAQQLRVLDLGQVVKVVADDPSIVDDLLAWCSATGHTMVHRRTHGKAWAFWVCKSG